MGISTNLLVTNNVTVSITLTNKDSAKKLCEDTLLKYFHKLQDNLTRFSLENYNGEVAYVGSTSLNKKEK